MKILLKITASFDKIFRCKTKVKPNLSNKK